MRLQSLVDVSNAVARTRSRLEKISRLAGALKQTAVDEIEIVVAYLSGALRQGRVGAGWSAVAGARTAGAAESPTLELREVDTTFGRIAAARGTGAAQKRADLLGALFAQATREEQDFLVRLISGDLRQGALEGILTDAVAAAANAAPELVRQASMMAGDLGAVARTALSEGPAALEKYKIELFRPIQPMLAASAESAAEAIELLGEAAFELKLDGARIQTHKAGDDVRVFSRGLRDVTAAVPEVVRIARECSAREFVLDGEVLALTANGMPLPFQETMRRFGRRLDVDRLRQELPLTPFFFDCLYLDGTPLVSEPQRMRFGALQSFATDHIVAQRIIGSGEAAESFLAEALRQGHEGLMAKALTAPYAAGSRGRSWLKIKVARTLDLVVLAAEWGSGRRRGWLSNLHLGARNEEHGGFVMLGKTFKGLTDETLEWQTRALLDRESGREGHIVVVRPELVVEVAFNDLQQSPHYPGGLALRFARVKGYRPDKTAADADTIATVQEIYRRMTGRMPPQPR
jgi:ATP-dependent DNA ligase I